MIVFPTPFFARNAIYRGPAKYIAFRTGYGLNPGPGAGAYSSSIAYLVSPDALRWYLGRLKGDINNHLRTDQVGAFIPVGVISAFGTLYLYGRICDDYANNYRPALFRLDADGFNRIATPLDTPPGTAGRIGFVDATMLGTSLVLVCNTGDIIASTNGTAFTKYTKIPLTDCIAIAGGTGVLVAVGDYNTIYSASTPAGPWTSRAYGSTSMIRCVAAGNILIAAGNDGKYATSALTSGTSWVSRTTPTGGVIFGLAWGGGRWLLRGDSSANEVLTSTDGLTFGAMPSPPWTNGLAKLQWAGDRWIVVGWNNVPYVSETGLDWTPGRAMQSNLGALVALAVLPS